MSWAIFLDSMPELLEAALGTLRMTAFAFVLAASLGLAIAILRMTGGLAGRAAFLYIEVVRGMPALTLLFLIYFGLAPLGIVLNTFLAAVVALGLNGAAYLAEVYRAGIQAVPKGHREAAQVLGLTPMQSFRRIVLPQAIRMTLPPLASNFVQLIKFSSLGAVISVNEITRRGMELSASNFRPLETFTFIAVVYFLICWPLAMAIRWWERRLQNR